MFDLTILKDYRGAFYSSSTNARAFCSMNLDRLFSRFTQMGWNVHIAEFPDLDFNQDWTKQVVLYTSSEDSGLEYKSYIEDIILGLSLVGAKLVPEYPYLRAHHNKVFMEILRQISTIPEANNLSSKYFGTFEDFATRTIKYPVVAKPAESSGSRGVKLLGTHEEANQITRKMTQSKYGFQAIKEFAKRKMINNYVPYSLNRRKVVLQEYIPNLAYDFKVLVYGKRVYVLKRQIRKNDFRASGSGMFSWPRILPEGLLDFVLRIFRGFDVAHASFDIAESKSGFQLLEAQFIDFGPLTLEKSPFHWYREQNSWLFVEAQSELELTFVDGVTEYAQQKGWFTKLEELAH